MVNIKMNINDGWFYGGLNSVINSQYRDGVKMNCVIRKQTFSICDKGADQLHSNCKADQPICFCYTDSTIPLLSESKISVLV